MKCNQCGFKSHRREDFADVSLLIDDALMLCNDCMWAERMRFIGLLEANDTQASKIQRETYKSIVRLAKELGDKPISFTAYKKQQDAEIALIKRDYLAYMATKN